MRLDLFVAVVTIPAVESAHEGGPVPHQCQMVPPLLFDGLAVAPNQTQRVYLHSRLVRLAVAQLVAGGLARILFDVPVAVAAVLAAKAAPGKGLSRTKTKGFPHILSCRFRW